MCKRTITVRPQRAQEESLRVPKRSTVIAPLPEVCNLRPVSLRVLKGAESHFHFQWCLKRSRVTIPLPVVHGLRSLSQRAPQGSTVTILLPEVRDLRPVSLHVAKGSTVTIPPPDVWGGSGQPCSAAFAT